MVVAGGCGAGCWLLAGNNVGFFSFLLFFSVYCIYFGVMSMICRNIPAKSVTREQNRTT
jgi:hypothetical protein